MTHCISQRERPDQLLWRQQQSCCLTLSQTLTPARRAHPCVPGHGPAVACLAWLVCSPRRCPYFGEAADIFAAGRSNPPLSDVAFSHRCDLVLAFCCTPPQAWAFHWWVHLLWRLEVRTPAFGYLSFAWKWTPVLPVAARRLCPVEPVALFLLSYHSSHIFCPPCAA